MRRDSEKVRLRHISGPPKCRSEHGIFLKMAEVLAIALAIATLTSGFAAGVELVQKLSAKWRDYRASRTNLVELVELERLQESLLLAQNTVQGAYDAQRQRYGQIFRVGDGAKLRGLRV